MRISYFALAIIFVAGTLFSQSNTCFGQTMDWMVGDNSIQGSDGGIVLSNSPMLIYAILAVSFLIAGAYMFGKAWEDQKMVFWAKTEGINFAMSVALIVIVIGAFISSCEISQAIGGIDNPNQSPAQAASLGLKSITDVFGVNFAVDLLKSSVKDQFDSMNYAYWSVPAMDGGGLAYSANLRAFSTQKELLIDIYLPLIMLIELQKLFLDVALPGVVALILPTALFFRMMFVTRDIGNILIALAFAIYFVMPLVYILALDATNGVAEMMCPTGSTDCGPDNPFGRIDVGKSTVVGDAFLKIGFVSAIALLIPNIVMIGIVTMTMSAYKALKGFGA